MLRATIALTALAVAGCTEYGGDPGFGGGPVYSGGYAPVYAGPPPVGYYGGGYYGRPPPPPPPGYWGSGWGGPGWNQPPGGPGLVARQQQYNQQITQQQQNYNAQIVAAQQRYNQQVSANPAGAGVYREQMNRDTAQAQRRLQEGAGATRKFWLGN